jgi:chorismate dehydratase
MTVRRIGAVGYLNTRPLVYGLADDPRVRLRFDLPSTCAALLHAGEVDAGMVPSIEFLRGDYRIVPGVAIASWGEVDSVALFTRVPLAEIRSIALDTSSRTSAALLRILCVERYGIAPRFEPHPPDLPSMLAACDSALLIGDPALFADPEEHGAWKIDLGAEWSAHTGLPFVWACWTGRAEALDEEVCGILQEARDRGVHALDEIARVYAAGDAAREDTARAYLRHNMKYDLREPHVQALRRFYASAAAIGVVPAAREPEFVGQRV